MRLSIKISSTIIILIHMLIFHNSKVYCYEGVEVYYSIHLASFKDLNNANGYVNKLAEKGKTVFWKLVDVPEKGEFYRVYLGKYIEREKAVEFWEKLKNQGAVSYFGVHKFKETRLPEDDEEIKELEPSDSIEYEEKEVIKKSSFNHKNRFVDNMDGTVTDTKTNLMWIKNGWRIDFVSAVKWKDAVNKCDQFKHAGYSDWRLPTIQEWKSLMDNKKEYPAMVEPNPFENVIVHMPYWSRSEYIYGFSKYGSKKVPAPRVYTVMLYYGRINHQSIDKRAFIMPVRINK